MRCTGSIAGALLALATAACARTARPAPAQAPGAGPARYLYVWAGDKDEKDSDFLAVYDVLPGSPGYGGVIATEPVGMTGTLPHHLEYQLPGAGQLLFANGHHHEQIFLFSLADASHPRLAKVLPRIPPYRYPHDFVRLPNGNVLIGFLRSEGASPLPGDSIFPGGHGGLAEVDRTGRVLRTASAADASVKEPIRTYAFAVLPALDRLLTTSAPMMEDHSADVVQIYQLSTLKLLHTLPLPPAKLPDGTVLTRAHRMPFEPRVMKDGSVLLNAYGCGFYRVSGLDGAQPAIHNVYTIDVGEEIGACGIPVIVGNYWVMAVGRKSMLVTLDIRDPAAPVEVARLTADTTFRPHWLALDPGSNRIIVGAENGGENRMLMARIDPATGRLSWDESLRSADGALGISFRRERWPHGETGEAFGHAALFRR